MSFQDAAEAIISNESERTAASPRFPPRNHDDLVQAREYEEMLDNYSFSKDDAASTTSGHGLESGAEPAYSIDATPARKDLRAEFYGEDPYASLKQVPVRGDSSYSLDHTSSPYNDPYGYAYGGGQGAAFDESPSRWQSATDQVISTKKGYLNALTDMVDVARQTSEQLFEILPYCQNDAAASELVLGLLSNTGFIQTEFTDRKGNTLLNVAAQTRNETVAQILLEEKHAKAHTVNHDGASPLHFTCASGTTSIPITKLLLTRRANPNLKDNNFGCTPLHYAASCADIDLVNTLLKYGADPSIHDNENFLPEQYAEQAMLSPIKERLEAARLDWEQNGSPPGLEAIEDDDQWEIHTDPNSGAKYEYNAKTGETRWLSVTKGNENGGDSEKDESARVDESDRLELDGTEADDNIDNAVATMSLEEQLAAEEKLRQERLADALRQIEPSRGLDPQVFKDAADVGVTVDAKVALESVLQEYPAAVDNKKEDAAKEAQSVNVTPFQELLSATAAQYHVDIAERRKAGKSEEYKSLEKEIELAVAAKKYGIADKLQQRLEAMEMKEEEAIQTGADAKVVLTHGLLLAWVAAAFREGAVGHAHVAQKRISSLVEKVRQLDDDAEFIRDSAAKRIMEAEQKAKAAAKSAAEEASNASVKSEEELNSCKSQIHLLEQQLEQVRAEAEALRNKAAGAELVQQDLSARDEEIVRLQQQQKAAAMSAAEQLQTWQEKCAALKQDFDNAREEHTKALDKLTEAHSAKVHVLNAKIAQIQKDVCAARAEAQRGKDTGVQLEAAQAATASLESSLAASTAAAEKAQTELREAHQQIEGLKRAAKEAEQASTSVVQQLELEKSALRNQVEALQQEVLDVGAKAALVDSANEKESALASQLADLREKLADAREKMAEGGHWKAQNDQLREALAKEQEDAMLAHQNASEAAEVAELKIIELESALEAEKAARRQDAADANARAVDAANTARTAQAELDTLRSELVEAQSKAEELEDVKDQLAGTKKEVARLSSELHESRDACEAAHADVLKLTSQLDTMREEKETALKQAERDMAETAGNKVRDLETTIGALNSKLASNEELHTKEVANLRETAETLSKAHAETVAKLNAELKQARDEAAELEVTKLQVEQLTAKVESMVARNEEIVQERVVEARRTMEQSVIAAQKEADTRVALARMDCDQEVKKIKKKNADLIQRWQKEQSLRRKYYNELEDMKGKIRVFARVRPLTSAEREKGCDMALTCQDEFSCSLVHRGRTKTFEFDRVFSPAASQTEVFADTKRLVQSAVDGYNVCIFAYGQTGSGKTFTMMGEGGQEGRLLGVGPRAINELFSIMNRDKKKFKFKLRVSMYELYRDSLIDLLWNPESKLDSPPSLEVKADPEGRVVVEGGTIVSVPGPAELGACFSNGMKRRHTAKTRMNDASSRSHLVQMIFVEATNKANKMTSLGKLTLVDLAGSERQAKTGAEGDVFEEAKAINKSLSALGNVINALTSGSSHVPYRDSKLTELMRDGIGGNAKTLMFVNLSPADYNAQEGMSSLGFAERCKKIRNKATTAVESKQLKKLKAELARLKDRKSANDPSKGSGSESQAAESGMLPQLRKGGGKLKRPGR